MSTILPISAAEILDVVDDVPDVFEHAGVLFLFQDAPVMQNYRQTLLNGQMVSDNLSGS